MDEPSDEALEYIMAEAAAKARERERKRKSDCAKALGQWLKKINVKKNANHDFFHGGLTLFLATNNVNFSIIGSMLA